MSRPDPLALRPQGPAASKFPPGSPWVAAGAAQAARDRGRGKGRARGALPRWPRKSRDWACHPACPPTRRCSNCPTISEVFGKKDIEFNGIECNNITFKYKEEEILKDYGFSLEEKNILG